MSVEFYGGSPGKLDSRALNRETLSRWTGRITCCHDIICIIIMLLYYYVILYMILLYYHIALYYIIILLDSIRLHVVAILRRLPRELLVGGLGVLLLMTTTNYYS